jgi:hypothetical protein
VSNGGFCHCSIPYIELRNEKGIMSEENNFVACPCQNCNGKIEFDASLFQTGTMIACPHCGMETALFIPSAPKASEKIIEKNFGKNCKAY